MFSKHLLKAGLILSLLLSSSILSGCGSGKKKSSGTGTPPPTEIPAPSADATPAPTDTSGVQPTPVSWEPWMQERWQDKSARLLRHGLGLGDADDRTALSHLSNRDYVSTLMNDPRFIDTILDFNLYFLGFKSDTQSDSFNGDGDSLVAAELGAKLPHAVTAAKEVQQGGDFLKLLKLQQPLYLRSLSNASLPDEGDDDGSDDDDDNMDQPNPVPAPSQKEIRQIVYALITTRLDSLIAAISGEQTTSQEFCSALGGIRFTDLFFSNVGVPDDVYEILDTEWSLSPSLSCFIQMDIDVPSQRLAFIRVREALPALFDLFESIDSEVYAPKTIAELKTFHLEDFGLKPGTQLTSGGFWRNLPNSSTNYNRRRASYVLKRYFCDDLTPISVVAPDVHTDNQHASSPACRSCHYKLDPMAGFFKENGFNGVSFEGSSVLLFDDGAQVDREKYQSSWKVPAGSDGSRVWDIGYVRSTEDLALNSWGESVPDLFRIIEAAPEVKKCVVRRLKDYFVGEDQAMDAGFLEHLSQRFIEESKTNSTVALKNVIADLVTSKTFMTADPISTACYDYAPGTDSSRRPPCYVAFVLERNCGSCHSSKASAGGLDLTGWIKLSDGSLSFPHRKGGVQQTHEQTFAVMQERLVTLDKKKRMPLDMHMSAVDREALFLWVEKKLSK